MFCLCVSMYHPRAVSMAGVASPGTGVIVSCELLVDTGNLTQILCKSSPPLIFGFKVQASKGSCGCRGPSELICTQRVKASGMRNLGHAQMCPDPGLCEEAVTEI